ncbi:uncharacterized protein AB675_9062 [Cyphellophora attinorum]|uniref:Ribonucleases P/MRP subunit Pop8-like domain-containing protein n=1 Tax=Cyphellophora attinorum TaxID=1664694 RepID=A0A0N1HW58_9EURO|nr:uncharacterized protein AB675_9062 [Phialophora attinorum]KPI41745.1 hypothetical protein AB675_9062 [Phialophora attinorum]
MPATENHSNTVTDVTTTTQSRPHPLTDSSTTTRTFRHPPYTYLHLTLLQPESNAPQPLDALTARQHIHAALTAHLGLHGAAVNVDVLRTGPPATKAWPPSPAAANNDGDSNADSSEDTDCWIRVPSQDENVVVGALATWTGRNGVRWVVRGRGSWLGGLR